ncbi:MAG TPA: hypothetical protein VI231_12300 [Candidatus Binatia bacterium]|jgi:hypothetical protein
MSWWIYKKDKDGKVYLISADVAPAILPAMTILGLLAAMLFPFLLQSGPLGMIQLLLWGGFLCLLAAKVSLFRRGIWFSWGTGQMTRQWARVYKIGYVLMGVGAVMTIAAYRANQ